MTFGMNKDETVDQMYNRLKLLVAEIRGLGSRDWDDAKFTKKLLRVFAPRNPCVYLAISKVVMWLTSSTTHRNWPDISHST